MKGSFFMLNRNLLAALVLAAASSAAFAAATKTDEPATQFTEGKGACTAKVEGTARQTAELKACERYYYPNGGGY
jgi:hypothetical protein